MTITMEPEVVTVDKKDVTFPAPSSQALRW